MMRYASAATRWLVIVREMISIRAWLAIVECAEAIARSRGADVLALAHLQRALDWLVLDK